MYHYLRISLTGGEHSNKDGSYFETNFEAHAARRGDPNISDVLMRGSVGDRSPVAVLSHGRIKVTIELLPEATK